ncbi:MAG TPA: hypothetical protein VND64_26155 [Pirellulales bacterium]|nr:hypothetical protein [Pirellulales bacterium]
MTPAAVRELIEREIAGNWSISNMHGCDLRRCLVEPELQEYEIRASGTPIGDRSSVTRLWLVLEEFPDDRRGYKIVYGEDARMFGLAVTGTPRDAFVGYYGTFLETFLAM